MNDVRIPLSRVPIGYANQKYKSINDSRVICNCEFK